MDLKILGSSSSGNCYLLISESEVLMIECGVRFGEVKKALDFNVSKITACLITHEHKDHCKHVKDVLLAGIDVYASLGTIKAIGINHHRFSRAKHGEAFKAGSFKILPFDVQHDAAEPLGFLIFQPEMGNTLFLTDSYYVKFNFPGLNHLLVEANYSEEILAENVESGRTNPFVAKRVESSHMSKETLIQMLQANDLRQVQNIVLLHLSDSNSNASQFQSEVQKLTRINTVIADKNITIPLNRYPF